MPIDISMASSTSTRLTVAEIIRVRDDCLERLRQDHLYQARNSAKLRAVKTSATYEEFKCVSAKKSAPPNDPINYTTN